MLQRVLVCVCVCTCACMIAPVACFMLRLFKTQKPSQVHQLGAFIQSLLYVFTPTDGMPDSFDLGILMISGRRLVLTVTENTKLLAMVMALREQYCEELAKTVPVVKVYHLNLVHGLERLRCWNMNLRECGITENTTLNVVLEIVREHGGAGGLM
jgi:hypothetical protein